jgi:hypothetical protein
MSLIWTGDAGVEVIAVALSEIFDCSAGFCCTGGADEVSGTAVEGVPVSGGGCGGRDGAQASASMATVTSIIRAGAAPAFRTGLDNISAVELYALMERDVHSAL